jgi:hypothetical protein
MGIQEEKCLKSWESKRKLADAMHLLPSDKKNKNELRTLGAQIWKETPIF